MYHCIGIWIDEYRCRGIGFCTEEYMYLSINFCTYIIASVSVQRNTCTIVSFSVQRNTWTIVLVYVQRNTCTIVSVYVHRFCVPFLAKMSFRNCKVNHSWHSCLSKTKALYKCCMHVWRYKVYLFVSTFQTFFYLWVSWLLVLAMRNASTIVLVSE